MFFYVGTVEEEKNKSVEFINLFSSQLRVFEKWVFKKRLMYSTLESVQNINYLPFEYA